MRSILRAIGLLECLERLTEPVVEDVETDESTAEVQKGQMDIGAAFVTDHQPTEPVEPPQTALNHPAEVAEVLTGVDARPSNAWTDATLAQGLAIRAGGIGFVGVQLGGPLAGPTRTSTWSMDRLDRIDYVFEERTFVDVGSREPDGEWGAPAVDHKMALRARFAAIRWIRTDLFGRTAPPLAGVMALSTLARDQSIWSASPSRSSRARCKPCQTPAACQSRSRRQQVMPQPQPSSAGRYSHGMPVLSTNRMPVRAARSETRGRPPLALGGSGGNSGSTMAHSSSGTNVFTPALSANTAPGFC